MVPVAVSSVIDDAVTGVDAGNGPVTVKVVAFTVVGFIRKPEGTVKVALMPVFGHAVAELAAGLVEATDTCPAAVGPTVVNVHT
jgi:hypothetical protein